MFQRTKLCAGIVLAFSGSAMLALPAYAQDGQRVEVTGSRIKTIETEGTSPVVTLSKEAIQVEGVRNVETLLNNLPQIFADQGGQVSNGASGTATVNLRNFGADRTLVLVNGRRLPAGSPRQLAADLNQIPVSLIKKIEVLTGGASAIYGSDAVAGVVNIILEDKFEGIAIDLNHEFFNHSQHNAIADVVKARGFTVPGDKSADGKVTDFSLTIGGNFADGKGNATVFLGHKQDQALLQSERDFTACALNAGAAWSCGGSGTSFPGQFTDFANYALTVANAQGGVRNYSGATDAYNFGPLNYFQRPSDRYTFAAMAHYDINDAARVYTEMSFHDDRTVAQIAPSGLFFFPATISYDNPLLSQAWKDAFHAANQANGLTFNKSGDTHSLYIARRNVEGGGRQDDIRHTSFRGVIGVKGDIDKVWSYDLSAQAGKVVFQETYKNDFSNARIGKALDVVLDANGKPVCRSALDGSDPNCVPYNIWSLGKVTPEALGYLQTPGFQKGFTSQQIVTGSISGDLTAYGIKTPWARGGLSLALGAERRSEEMDLSTDSAFTTGDLAGQGGPTIGVGGAYSVNDIFAEARLPLIEKAPWAELLAANVAVRYSDYSTGQTTSTYGLGLEWAPTKSLKFRASTQSAARAANIVELYSAAGLGLYDNDADPCAGANPTATLIECQRTGVTAAQYGKIPDSPAGQYNAIFGGNPALKAEKSSSWTLGIAFNPITDMNVTLDVFHLKVKDVIGSLSPTTTLTECLTTGNPAFCNLINRDGIGSLWATNNAFILANNLNLGMRSTEGLDVSADYRMKLQGMGRLDFQFVGTWLKNFMSEDVPGLGSYDCAGYYGATCGTPLPKWRHKLRTTWKSPWDVDLALTWRHIDSVDIDTSSSDPHLSGNFSDLVKTLGSRDYLDVAASYKLNKNVTLSAAINNLLDKDPPIRTNGAGFVNGNTYPVVYDAMGRRISLTLNAKF